MPDVDVYRRVVQFCRGIYHALQAVMNPLARLIERGANRPIQLGFLCDDVSSGTCFYLANRDDRWM